MAKMYKCDRCGKTFSNKDISKNFSAPSVLYEGCLGDKQKYSYKYDLCPKCTEEWNRWFFAKKKKENE